MNARHKCSRRSSLGCKFVKQSDHMPAASCCNGVLMPSLVKNNLVEHHAISRRTSCLASQPWRAGDKCHGRGRSPRRTGKVAQLQEWPAGPAVRAQARCTLRCSQQKPQAQKRDKVIAALGNASFEPPRCTLQCICSSESTSTDPSRHYKVIAALGNASLGPPRCTTRMWLGSAT